MMIKISDHLIKATESKSSRIIDIIQPMQAKFDKYWRRMEIFPPSPLYLTLDISWSSSSLCDLKTLHPTNQRRFSHLKLKIACTNGK